MISDKLTACNRLTVHFAKRETALKWMLLTVGYFACYSFMENPFPNTISNIGRHHYVLFSIFCLIYSIAMIVNGVYLDKHFGAKPRLFYRLYMGFSSCFCFVATTLLFDKSLGEPTTFAVIMHWFFGFGGILVNAVCAHVFILDLYRKTKNRKLLGVFIGATTVCVADLLMFLVLTLINGGNVQLAKNGFLEIVPMSVTFFLMYYMNHTNVLSPIAMRDEQENTLKANDSSLFSSVSFACLVAAFITFTFYAFVRNPIHYTVSMTGVEYPIGFAVMSVCLAAAFLTNFIMMFRKNGCKNVLIWALALIGSPAILLCVIFPTTLDDTLNPVHSISALVFFYFIFAAFLLYGFTVRKKTPYIFRWTLILLALTSIALVVLFVILKQKYGRTGLTELIPMEFFMLVLLKENHT